MPNGTLAAVELLIIPGVQEMTVRPASRTRRRYRWALGGFTVVWFGLGVAAVISARHGSLASILIIIGIFLAVWLPVGLILTLRIAGYTRIGPDGLRFRGLFTSGFVSWGDVVEFTDRFHPGRGVGWWSVEARLSDGRARRLPGFYCESRNPVVPDSTPKRDKEFDDQLMDLRLLFRQRHSA